MTFSLQDLFQWPTPGGGGGGGSSGGETPVPTGGQGDAVNTSADTMLRALSVGPTGYPEHLRANLGMDKPIPGYDGGARQPTMMTQGTYMNGYQPVTPPFDPLKAATETGPATPVTMDDLYLDYQNVGGSSNDDKPFQKLIDWFSGLFNFQGGA